MPYIKITFKRSNPSKQPHKHKDSRFKSHLQPQYQLCQINKHNNYLLRRFPATNLNTSLSTSNRLFPDISLLSQFPSLIRPTTSIDLTVIQRALSNQGLLQAQQTSQDVSPSLTTAPSLHTNDNTDPSLLPPDLIPRTASYRADQLSNMVAGVPSGLSNDLPNAPSTHSTDFFPNVTETHEIFGGNVPQSQTPKPLHGKPSLDLSLLTGNEIMYDLSPETTRKCDDEEFYQSTRHHTIKQKIRAISPRNSPRPLKQLVAITPTTTITTTTDQTTTSCSSSESLVDNDPYIASLAQTTPNIIISSNNHVYSASGVDNTADSTIPDSQPTQTPLTHTTTIISAPVAPTDAQYHSYSLPHTPNQSFKLTQHRQHQTPAQHTLFDTQSIDTIDTNSTTTCHDTAQAYLLLKVDATELKSSYSQYDISIAEVTPTIVLTAENLNDIDHVVIDPDCRTIDTDVPVTITTTTIHPNVSKIHAAPPPSTSTITSAQSHAALPPPSLHITNNTSNDDMTITTKMLQKQKRMKRAQRQLLYTNNDDQAIPHHTTKHRTVREEDLLGIYNGAESSLPSTPTPIFTVASEHVDIVEQIPIEPRLTTHVEIEEDGFVQVNIEDIPADYEAEICPMALDAHIPREASELSQIVQGDSDELADNSENAQSTPQIITPVNAQQPQQTPSNSPSKTPMIDESKPPVEQPTDPEQLPLPETKIVCFTLDEIIKLKDFIEPNSVLIFDIDDTLISAPPTSRNHLIGTHSGLKYFNEKLTSQYTNLSYNFRSYLLKECNNLKKITMLSEHGLVEFLSTIYNKIPNLTILCLTARDESLSKTTKETLKQFSLNFNQYAPISLAPGKYDVINIPESAEQQYSPEELANMSYFIDMGIVYTNANDKGIVLYDILQRGMFHNNKKTIDIKYPKGGKKYHSQHYSNRPEFGDDITKIQQIWMIDDQMAIIQQLYQVFNNKTTKTALRNAQYNIPVIVCCNYIKNIQRIEAQSLSIAKRVQELNQLGQYYALEAAQQNVMTDTDSQYQPTEVISYENIYDLQLYFFIMSHFIGYQHLQLQIQQSNSNNQQTAYTDLQPITDSQNVDEFVQHRFLPYFSSPTHNYSNSYKNLSLLAFSQYFPNQVLPDEVAIEILYNLKVAPLQQPQQNINYSLNTLPADIINNYNKQKSKNHNKNNNHNHNNNNNQQNRNNNQNNYTINQNSTNHNNYQNTPNNNLNRDHNSYYSRRASTSSYATVYSHGGDNSPNQYSGRSRKNINREMDSKKDSNHQDDSTSLSSRARPFNPNH